MYASRTHNSQARTSNNNTEINHSTESSLIIHTKKQSENLKPNTYIKHPVKNHINETENYCISKCFMFLYRSNQLSEATYSY